MSANPSSIPLVQTNDRNVNQLQQNFKKAIEPVLKNPIVTGTILTSVTLNSGSNSISHGLGRAIQGWTIIRQRAQANIWDSQDSNTTPQSTLALNASAKVTVDIYVF
jgi:hypothetical protein